MTPFAKTPGLHAVVYPSKPVNVRRMIKHRKRIRQKFLGHTSTAFGSPTLPVERDDIDLFATDTPACNLPVVANFMARLHTRKVIMRSTYARSTRCVYVYLNAMRTSAHSDLSPFRGT